MEKMNYIIFGKQKDIAFIQSEGSMIKDTQSALGLMMSARYEMGCNKLILNKSCFAGEFFMLSSGLCGEILQKFVNDQMKAAIAGDFTKYTRNLCATLSIRATKAEISSLRAALRRPSAN